MEVPLGDLLSVCDQFWAVDAGLPDLFNQISLLVLFQAVCFFVPCFETDSEFHWTCHVVVDVPEYLVGMEIGVGDVGGGGGGGGKMYGWWLCESAIRQSTSERSGMMLLLITFSTASCLVL